MSEVVVVNTRNRPKIKGGADPGMAIAVAELTDVSDVLRLATERLDEAKDGLFPNEVQTLSKGLRKLDQRIIRAIESIEKSSSIIALESDPLPPLFRSDRVPLPSSPTPIGHDEASYIKENGKVDGEKLYQLAHQIEWECGDARCVTCPFNKGGRDGAESQRRECLDFYLTERLKRIVVDQLVTGLPYTKSQLENMHRRDLTDLVNALGINPHRIRGRSSSEFIDAILEAQTKLTAEIPPKKKAKG